MELDQTAAFRMIPDLLAEVSTPEKGILSRTLLNDDHFRVVIFAFDAGQELTAHTAPMAAIIQILQGEAALRLGGETVDARAGTLVHMTPRLEHGIVARTPTVMLLTMLKDARD